MKAEPHKESRLFALLVKNYLLFTLTLLIIAAGVYLLWDYRLNRLFDPFDWDSLVTDARLAEGDQAASSTLIEHNLRLVVYIARRFENTGINIEDLISIGTIGLIKAVGTYQPAKNIKLATYASRCIENEILMHLRKTASLKSEVPFDEPLSTDWNGNELLLSDILGTESDLVMRPMEEDADRQLLADALEKLTQREREIITLRFGLGGRREHTQKEVADRMGISQSYISRLEKRIIGRLKREILKVTEIP